MLVHMSFLLLTEEAMMKMKCRMAVHGLALRSILALQAILRFVLLKDFIYLQVARISELINNFTLLYVNLFERIILPNLH